MAEVTMCSSKWCTVKDYCYRSGKTDDPAAKRMDFLSGISPFVGCYAFTPITPDLIDKPDSVG